MPVKSGIYTVRRIIANLESSDGPPGVALEEIRGSWDFLPTYYGTTVYEEVHFRMNRFKEVVPPHLMENFIEALTREPIKVEDKIILRLTDPIVAVGDSWEYIKSN